MKESLHLHLPIEQFWRGASSLHASHNAESRLLEELLASCSRGSSNDVRSAPMHECCWNSNPEGNLVSSHVVLCRRR
jgi:hypothetical protein